jgi:hypothetical protein
VHALREAPGGREAGFSGLRTCGDFGGRAVIDVLSTHPLVVMDDRMYENPHYVAPRDFLERLMRREPGGLVSQPH